MMSSEMTALLKAERIRQGLPQAEVAKRMGVPASFVQEIEGKGGDRKSSTFERYALALGMQFEVSLRRWGNNEAQANGDGVDRPDEG